MSYIPGVSEFFAEACNILLDCSSMIPDTPSSIKTEFEALKVKMSVIERPATIEDLDVQMTDHSSELYIMYKEISDLMAVLQDAN
jgi:hypothetical protein